MNTSLMKPLMSFELTGVYDLDHNTTPEVVKISKLSSIVPSVGRDLAMPWERGSLHRVKWSPEVAYRG